MYEKYGFRRIPGVHSRDADLDQYAVAMHYSLAGGADEHLWHEMDGCDVEDGVRRPLGGETI
jgi:hypothetical protein